MRMVCVNARVRPELVEQLRELARLADRKPSEVIRRLLEEGVRRHAGRLAAERGEAA